jgi:hypothetical protein
VNNCLVLDFDEENGSSFPRILKRLAGYVYSSKQAKNRRDTVGKYFPRLAYLLSHVIILMGQNDIFSNARYVERANQFAFQAVGNIQSLHGQ